MSITAQQISYERSALPEEGRKEKNLTDLQRDLDNLDLALGALIGGKVRISDAADQIKKIKADRLRLIQKIDSLKSKAVADELTAAADEYLENTALRQTAEAEEEQRTADARKLEAAAAAETEKINTARERELSARRIIEELEKEPEASE